MNESEHRGGSQHTELQGCRVEETVAARTHRISPTPAFFNVFPEHVCASQFTDPPGGGSLQHVSSLNPDPGGSFLTRGNTQLKSAQLPALQHSCAVFPLTLEESLTISAGQVKLLHNGRGDGEGDGRGDGGGDGGWLSEFFEESTNAIALPPINRKNKHIVINILILVFIFILSIKKLRKALLQGFHNNHSEQPFHCRKIYWEEAI